MNGYTNNGFTQSLNGILSITDGLGTTIENGSITTGDITGDDIVASTVTSTLLKSTNLELSGNLTIDNNLTVDGTTVVKACLNIDCGESGQCIDFAYGSSSRVDGFYGTIRYNQFGGLVLTGDHINKRIDMFGDNVYIHANLNVDSNFYWNAILYCNSIGAQSGQYLLLNSDDSRDIYINYFKPSSGGKVIFNRSCLASNSSVNIEQGNLNVENGNCNISNNLTISGIAYIPTANITTANITTSNTTNEYISNTLYTNKIDVKVAQSDVYIYPNGGNIYIGSTQNTLMYIKCYSEFQEFVSLQKGFSSYVSSSTSGITNDTNNIVNNLTTDSSSLLSTASTIFNGGVIIKKNLYSSDVMTDSLTSGNIGCGNLNSSNNITCVDLVSDSITTNSLNVSDIGHFKGKLCANINITISPYLSFPLTYSIYDTINGIKNFNLQTYLINSNDNTIFVQPYYSIIFYNYDTILQIIDNSINSTTMFAYIIFNQNLVCTKIIILYKNNLI